MKNQGFTLFQLKQLKTLFTQQRRYTDKKFAEQQTYTDKKFSEQQTYTDKKFTEAKLYTDKQFRKLIRLINKTKNELQQSIATLAIHSPTRKEFDALKERMNYSHPEL